MSCRTKTLILNTSFKTKLISVYLFRAARDSEHTRLQVEVTNKLHNFLNIMYSPITWSTWRLKYFLLFLRKILHNGRSVGWCGTNSHALFSGALGTACSITSGGAMLVRPSLSFLLIIRLLQTREDQPSVSILQHYVAVSQLNCIERTLQQK